MRTQNSFYSFLSSLGPQAWKLFKALDLHLLSVLGHSSWKVDIMREMNMLLVKYGVRLDSKGGEEVNTSSVTSEVIWQRIHGLWSQWDSE